MQPYGVASTPATASTPHEMHSYSIDTELRRTVYATLAVVAVGIPTGFAYGIERVRELFQEFPSIGWPLSFGTTFGLLFVLFNSVVWKWSWMRKIHGIPNLNGKWEGEGLSSFELDPTTQAPAHRFHMRVTIRQTFSRIEVSTNSDDSTSRSTMASFELEHAIATFSYAFQNLPKNKADAELQRHPGLIELRLETADELVGDYFSGKHRLRYGELTLRRTA